MSARSFWPLLLFVLLVPVAVAAQAPPAGEVMIEYKVKPGDTLRRIARQLYGDAGRTDLILNHNDLGPPPHKLTPGQVLRVPREPGPDAIISNVRNQVRLEGIESREARQGDGLKRGHRVSTGDGAAAEITFSDGTRVSLGERSLLVIVGEDAGADHPKASDTTLRRGRLEAHIAPARPGYPPPLVVLATPNAQVKMGASDGVLEYDDSQGTRAEVRTGEWRVKAKGKEVKVAAGFTTRVEPGQAPAKPAPVEAVAQAPAAPPAVQAPPAPPAAAPPAPPPVAAPPAPPPVAAPPAPPPAAAPPPPPPPAAAPPPPPEMAPPPPTVMPPPVPAPVEQVKAAEPAPPAQVVTLELGLVGGVHLLKAAQGSIGQGIGPEIGVRFRLPSGALVLALRPLYEHYYAFAADTRIACDFELAEVRCQASPEGNFAYLRGRNMFSLSIPVEYRFRDPERAFFVPYVGLVPQVLFDWMRVSDRAREEVVRSTRAALVAFAGLQLRTGRNGAAFFEAGYRHVFTEDRPPSTTDLRGAVIMAGYRHSVR